MCPGETGFVVARCTCGTSGTCGCPPSAPRFLGRAVTSLHYWYDGFCFPWEVFPGFWFQMNSLYTGSLVNGRATLLLFSNPITDLLLRKLVFDNLNKLLMLGDLPVIFNHADVRFVLHKWMSFTHFVPTLFGQKIRPTELHALKSGCE